MSDLRCNCGSHTKAACDLAGVCGQKEIDLPVAPCRLLETRALLQDFLDYHTRPAGLNIAILQNDQDRTEFFNKIKERERTLIERARKLLGQ